MSTEAMDQPEPLNDLLYLRATKPWLRSLKINGSSIHGASLVSKQILHRLKGFPRRTLARFPLLDKVCPYCSTRLSAEEHADRGDAQEWYLWFSPTIARVEYCGNCLYWRLHHLETFAVDRAGITEVHDYTSHISKLQEFEPNMPEGCSSGIVN